MHACIVYTKKMSKLSNNFTKFSFRLQANGFLFLFAPAIHRNLLQWIETHYGFNFVSISDHIQGHAQTENNANRGTDEFFPNVGMTKTGKKRMKWGKKVKSLSQ